MKIATSLVVLGALSLAMAAGPEKAVGKPLPNLFVTGLDGKKISTSDFKGKVVILDFWATWCGPCKKAGPTMDALQKKYAGKVRVIGASYDDPPAAVKKYMSEHKYGYTFATGGKAAGDTLGVVNLPAIFIIDAKGIVRHVATGWDAKSPAAFETALKKAM